MPVTKKSTKTSKATKIVARNATSVIAFSGKKRVKTFKSIAEAARWVQSNNPNVSSRTSTIAASICSASLGRESRETGGIRETAYGYSWKRNS